MSWTDVQHGSREKLWLGLLVLGVAVPYAHAVPWFVDNGPDAGLFADELFAGRTVLGLRALPGTNREEPCTPVRRSLADRPIEVVVR